MKSTGIVREMDPLGRMVIPKEIRETLDIKTHDPVEIFTDGEQIIMKKYHRTCIFCGSTEETFSYQDKLICKNCLSALNQAAEEGEDTEE